MYIDNFIIIFYYIIIIFMISILLYYYDYYITIAEDMDIDAAEHRIKEWCVRGYDIRDGENAVKDHMKPRPRNWRASDLRPLETLEGLIRK